jgi:hypothetical protein
LLTGPSVPYFPTLHLNSHCNRRYHAHHPHFTALVRCDMIDCHSQNTSQPCVNILLQISFPAYISTRSSLRTRRGSAGPHQPCDETLKRFNPHLASCPSLWVVFALLPMSILHCYCMISHTFSTFCVIRGEPGNFASLPGLDAKLLIANCACVLHVA